MNNTFFTWLVAAGVAALALLLVLGSPSSTERSAATGGANGGEEVGSETSAESVSYWESVVETPITVRVPVERIVSAPVTTSCSACGPSLPQAAESLVGGCRPSPVVPCQPEPCRPLMSSCCDPCVDPCWPGKPGINRNMSFCVDECSFIQLHSTVPQPTGGCVAFHWNASRGSFLDPTASDPLYYAPTTHFPSGEDVWITLTIIGPDGASYSDYVKIHLRDVR